jgi:hypothetical protein
MLLLRACLSGAAVASLEPVWETDVHTPHELGRPLLQLLERGASSDGEQQRPPPHPPRPPVPPMPLHRASRGRQSDAQPYNCCVPLTDWTHPRTYCSVLATCAGR